MYIYKKRIVSTSSKDLLMSFENISLYIKDLLKLINIIEKVTEGRTRKILTMKRSSEKKTK